LIILGPGRPGSAGPRKREKTAMTIPMKELLGLSVEDLKAALRAKKQMDRIGPLTEKRDRLARQKERIEKELAKIEQKIAILQGDPAPAQKRRPGRPPKAASDHAAPANPPEAEEAGADRTPREAEPGQPETPGKKEKRTLSPEARARIVAAQKKRWAEFKARGKASGGKAPGAKSPKAEAPAEKDAPAQEKPAELQA